MLTLTETASNAINTIVAQSPTTDTGGLRIKGNGTTETEFQVTVAPAPEEADAIVEKDGARVFLEPIAAVALDDKVLDAQITDEGAVSFALAAQTA